MLRQKNEKRRVTYRTIYKGKRRFGPGNASGVQRNLEQQDWCSIYIL